MKRAVQRMDLEALRLLDIVSVIAIKVLIRKIELVYSYKSKTNLLKKSNSHKKTDKAAGKKGGGPAWLREGAAIIQVAQKSVYD